MATKERPADRGARRGRELYLRAAHELRIGRVDRALSLDDVGAAVDLSAAEVSRIERGLVPSTSVVRLAQLHAVVGLELSVRSFAGGQPIRDASHAALLTRLRLRLHQRWRWATEVPLPIPGDQRAWDALVWLPECRYGIEAEMAPSDSQALVRRLTLKQRDGQVDGVILVVPATRRVRAFLAAAQVELEALFPIPGKRALELLEAGVDPGGGSVIILGR
jgi:transcriptional regulator with XRE-family HTH domain